MPKSTTRFKKAEMRRPHNSSYPGSTKKAFGLEGITREDTMHGWFVGSGISRCACLVAIMGGGGGGGGGGRCRKDRKN